MPARSFATALAFALAATLAAESALAHGRGGFRGGLVVRAPVRAVPHAHFSYSSPRARLFIAAPIVAAPFYYAPRPIYYGPPAVHYVPPVVAPQYIEQEASANQYWYWCSDANAYYPYVKECPGGWQAVTPQAPPS